MRRSSPPSLPPRRAFLGQAAAATLAIAAGASSPALAAAAIPAGRRKRKDDEWDDSWTERLAGRHCAVLDAAAADGGALGEADSVMSGYHDALGTDDGDCRMVIVIRHRGIPMAFGDAIWEKYELGKELDIKDPSTGKPARRNPFLHVTKEDRHALVEATSSLESLRERGVILLGCNVAAMGYGARLADRTKGDREAIRAELKANLVPGVILQPNGLYALARAQERGCGYVRWS